GNLGLAAKAKPAHSHAIGGIGVRGNSQAASFGNQPVGGQHVGGGADRHRAGIQLVLRHVEREQQVLQLAHRSFGWKDAQNVEAESGGELESGQQQDLVQQAPVFVQALAFLGLQAVQALEQLQLRDLVA